MKTIAFEPLVRRVNPINLAKVPSNSVSDVATYKVFKERKWHVTFARFLIEPVIGADSCNCHLRISSLHRRAPHPMQSEVRDC